MVGTNQIMSNSSASSHTKKEEQKSSSGMLKKLPAILLLCTLAWAYQVIQPPPPNICGSPNGPPVTAPRITLKDGRHLAYKEHGVPRDMAKYKIVYVHGFDSCRHDVLPISSELAEELSVYVVSFDRAGYGQSDPNPKRTVKSTATDMEELADQLELGSKFYVIGFSMGGQVIWTCLKYIPHRLSGAALLAPVANFWWSGLPANVSREAFNQQLPADRWAVGVAHYFPWLTSWWNTQRWFPICNVIAHSPDIFSPQDKALSAQFEGRGYLQEITQQGVFDTLHRDLMIGFGKWDFSPLDLHNPFPNNEGSVHLWHGDEDRIVPIGPMRYITKKLPWIKYHEVPGAGHLFPLADGFGDAIVKELVLTNQ